MLTFILLLVAFGEYKELMLGVLGIVGAYLLWKTGLIQSITGGQKQLIDLRTAELTQAKEKNAELAARIKELEEYNRLLILNSRTTMEVAMQLKKEESAKDKKND